MVDVSAGVATRQQDAPDEADSFEATVEISSANDAALAEYEDFCRNAVHGAPQHPLWVRAWLDATGTDAIIVTLKRHARPMLSMALEVVGRGPFKVAAFPGGRHANGSFAAWASSDVDGVTAAEIRLLKEQMRAARPDIDLVELERQKPELDGIANPLADFASSRSPNVSLATDLSGGMDRMLDRMSGKRKRKKHRAQLRKMKAAGGYRLFAAEAPEEVDRLMSAFYTLKAARFQKRGIPDVFAPETTRTFFRTLFRDALSQRTPPFLLYGLEVAGEIHNVKGFTVGRNGLISEFCAMREDESGLSPGFFLDYEVMAEISARGMTVYDFSVGDEEYKRSWCDIETWLFDMFVPLTAKGRALFAFRVARNRAIGFIKSNSALWAAVRKLRTRLGYRAGRMSGAN